MIAIAVLAIWLSVTESMQIANETDPDAVCFWKMQQNRKFKDAHMAERTGSPVSDALMAAWEAALYDFRLHKEDRVAEALANAVPYDDFLVDSNQLFFLKVARFCVKGIPAVATAWEGGSSSLNANIDKPSLEKCLQEKSCEKDPDSPNCPSQNPKSEL